MSQHLELGQAGEELAAAWLAQRGYTLLHRNWRHGRQEIDIIAEKGKFLHFIEVKTLRHNSLGHPEDSVTKKKFRHLKRAADEYLHQHPGHKWIRYDVLAITVYPDREEYYLLEDVFL